MPRPARPAHGAPGWDDYLESVFDDLYGRAPVVGTNWCSVVLGSHTLTTASPTHLFVASDITIGAQAGDDFTVGTSESSGLGAVFSATGGYFQFSAYVGSPVVATLDGSSAAQRFLWFGAVGTSDLSQPAAQFGVDFTAPVFAGGPSFPAQCAASNLAYAAPGTEVVYNPLTHAQALVGTDSVQVDPILLYIWQVA